MKQNRALIKIAVIGVVFAGLILVSWLAPSKKFSISERRLLAQLPDISFESVFDGRFMKQFEKYATDQFPARDFMRKVKSTVSCKLLGQLDNHGIYIENGYAAKLDYPLDKESLSHASKRFEYIYKTYLEESGSDIYFSVIPDKGYFLTKENGYPCMDYDELIRFMKDNMSYAEYIDIIPTLDITDYYRTDAHWRQERLLDTASVIAGAMGVSTNEFFREAVLDIPFYGVYCGQSAMSMTADAMYYFTDDTIEGCIVTDHESGKTKAVYDMMKAYGNDPYEMFLSGARSLITIDNPNCGSGRELIVFRDSFASSIAPLLAGGYSKITLVDIRYLRPEFLGKFMEFGKCDVLFLYSTSVLNNSETIM